MMRILSTIVFVVVMTIDITLSLVVVLCLYLPFVVLKAVVLAITGKARPKITAPGASQPAGQ